VKILIGVIFSLFILAGAESSFAQTASPSFTNPVSLSNSSADSQSPQLVVSQDGIFAVWEEIDSERSNIFFSKSVDGGTTFGNPINLSGSVLGQSDSPVLVQKDKNVYVVWRSSISGNSVILFSKSNDGGTSFEKPVRISNDSKTSAFPHLTMSESHVYSSWVEKSSNTTTNILLAKSDDQGISFQTPLYITQTAGNTGIPNLSADGNQVYLIWEDDHKGNFEIFLTKSDDNGTSFDTPLDISNNAGQSGAPQIVVSQNNLYAVWMDNTSGNIDILFAKSIDGGKSFGKSTNISNLSSDSGYPQFSVSGSNVYVAWTQTMPSKNYDIFFAKSNDTGKTFTTPINLSHDSGGSGWPQIASDGNIHVAWVDDSTGKFNILVSKSSNKGVSFEGPINISNTKSESYDANIAKLGKDVYVVWQEGVQGNHTIVFSKSMEKVTQVGNPATTLEGGATGNPNVSNFDNTMLIILGVLGVGIAILILYFIKRRSRPIEKISSD